MDDQQRLFVGAVESAIIGARYVPGAGWNLRLQIRRQFEEWEDARTEAYEGLTTGELVDVLEVSLGHLVSALGG